MNSDELFEEFEFYSQFPKYYLSSYFADLKQKVDVKFVKEKINNRGFSNSKWASVIEKISTFETECLNNLKNKNFEITSKDSLEKDVLISEFNKFVFSNKSILFIDKSKSYKIKNSFKVVIIHDECIPNEIAESFCFNKQIDNELKDYHVKLHILRDYLDDPNEIIDINLSLAHLLRLDMSYERISSIHANTFNMLRNLEILRLTYNQIEILDDKALKNLAKLKQLFLYFNKIKTIHRCAFNDLVNLERIDLSYNKIKHIDFSWFSNLSKLKSLDLHENMICSLDADAFKHLSNLNELNLGSNKLTKISSFQFKHLTSLTKLRLCYNSISQLDEDAFNSMNSLRILELTFNKLNTIKANVFRGLSNLRCLLLDYNDVFHIDDEAFNDLDELKILNLYKNEIKELNFMVFRNLKNLSLLYLRQNQLKNIDSTNFSIPLCKIFV